jgi:hypothetical protein
VVRIYHQELESFLKSDWAPLHGNQRLTIFFKERNRKRKTPVNRSSNALWVIEMREVGRGGIVQYGQEVRLKHLGSERYLAVRRPTDGGSIYLALDKELDDRDTLFTFQAVDKVKTREERVQESTQKCVSSFPQKADSNDVSLADFFRIQHPESGTWLHVFPEERSGTTFVQHKIEVTESKSEAQEKKEEIVKEKSLIFEISLVGSGMTAARRFDSTFYLFFCFSLLFLFFRHRNFTSKMLSYSNVLRIRKLTI